MSRQQQQQLQQQQQQYRREGVTTGTSKFAYSNQINNGDIVTLKVIRTEDASIIEIGNINLLSTTLHDVKEQINSLLYGNNSVKGEQLRLFHLGRELKNGGRTLQRLGLGRHDNFILHVHGAYYSKRGVRTRKTTTNAISTHLNYNNEDIEVVNVQQGQQQQNRNSTLSSSHVNSASSGTEVIDLLDDGDNEDKGNEVIVIDSSLKSQSHHNQKRRRMS